MNQKAVDSIQGRQLGLELAICAIARQLRPEQAAYAASWLHAALQEEASSDATTARSEAFQDALNSAVTEVNTALSVASGS